MGTKTRLLVGVALLVSAAAMAQVPAKLGYSGRLLKAAGGPETGTVNLKFTVYDAASVGSIKWTETQSLLLGSDGTYSTFLGEAAAIPTDVFDGSGPRFLELQVNGGTPLVPRQPINSVPYALTSRSVKGGTADVTALKLNGQDLLVNGRLATAFGYQAGSGVSIDSGNSVSLLACTSQNQVLLWDTGTSAWQCGNATGPAGPTGTQGIQGLAGATGAVGATGATGASVGWVASGNMINNSNSGNVGVGTTTPTEKLEVSGKAKASEFYIKAFTLPSDGNWYKVAGAGGQWGRIAYRYDNASSNAPVISSGEIMVINDNYSLRQHHKTTQYGANYNLQFARSGNTAETGVIWVKASGTTSGTFVITENTNCSIYLDGTNAVTPPAGVGQVIYPQLGGDVDYFSHNVGIGTTAPTEKLAVVGSAAKAVIGAASHTSLYPGYDGQGVTALDVNASGEYAGLNLINDGSTTTGIVSFFNKASPATEKRLATFAVQPDGDPASGRLLLFTNNAGTFAERMRIDRAGNVGIGTTAPAAKLEVAGVLAHSGGGTNAVRSFLKTVVFDVPADSAQIMALPLGTLSAGSINASGSWGSMMLRAVAVHRGMSLWTEYRQFVVTSGDYRGARQIASSTNSTSQFNDIQVNGKSINAVDITDSGTLQLLWNGRTGLNVHVTVFMEWTSDMGFTPL